MAPPRLVFLGNGKSQETGAGLAQGCGLRDYWQYVKMQAL